MATYSLAPCDCLTPVCPALCSTASCHCWCDNFKLFHVRQFAFTKPILKHSWGLLYQLMPTSCIMEAVTAVACSGSTRDLLAQGCLSRVRYANAPSAAPMMSYSQSRPIHSLASTCGVSYITAISCQWMYHQIVHAPSGSATAQISCFFSQGPARQLVSDPACHCFIRVSAILL